MRPLDYSRALKALIRSLKGPYKVLSQDPEEKLLYSTLKEYSSVAVGRSAGFDTPSTDWTGGREPSSGPFSLNHIHHQLADKDLIGTL